jgi:mitogen-activated protein kinase 1/3
MLGSDGRPLVFDLPPFFKVEAVVGQGAFGAVCKAKQGERGTDVAIKKVPNFAKSHDSAKKVLREIEIISHFQFCTQIVPCYAIFRPTSNEKDIYMIMDYVPSDLSSVIKNPLVAIDDAGVKSITCQLLLALRALHAHGCIHRDLSTRNILIDDQCRVFVCDFGLSRFFDPDEQLSFGVVTQWYRAPEIICDAQYDFKVDVWSVGVILGELLLRKHLFPGLNNDSADQLSKIFCYAGTPPAAIFSESGSMSKASDNAKKYSLMYIERKPQHCKLAGLPSPHITDGSRALLLDLLKVDPSQRPTADEALKHPWFDSLRDYINREVAVQDQAPPANFTGAVSFDEALRKIDTAAPQWTAEMQQQLEGPE